MRNISKGIRYVIYYYYYYKRNIKITRWLYQGAHLKNKIYWFTYLQTPPLY